MLFASCGRKGVVGLIVEKGLGKKFLTILIFDSSNIISCYGYKLYFLHVACSFLKYYMQLQ